jgi:hypothetical protein
MSGGMIGIIADYSGRFSWFSQCLADLVKPEDTKIEWRMGANRGAMRNALAQACLDGGYDWLFFVDDDQCFGTGVLTRLLSHDQPVVSALIVQRAAPFLPTAYAGRDDDGNYQTLDLRSVGSNNLVLVAATGTGGLLVRADVLRQLGPPWFVYSEAFGEDLFFANRLAEAGVPMLVDTGCRMGHIAPAAVFPVPDGDGWKLDFTYSDGTTIPMAINHDKGD